MEDDEQKVMTKLSNELAEGAAFHSEGGGSLHVTKSALGDRIVLGYNELLQP